MRLQLYHVALGMAYLHGENIIHCDLKAVCAFTIQLSFVHLGH